jgi:hypothetical protein
MSTVRRRLPPAALAVAALLLVPAAAAQAKGIASLAVCGPHHCVNRTEVALRGVQYPEQLLSGGTPVADGAVTAEPFVRVRMGIGDGTRHSKVYGRMTLTLLPRAGFLQMEDGSWGQLQGGDLRAFRRVVRGVPRYPAERLRLADGMPVPGATATAAPVKDAAGTGRAVTVRATATEDGTSAWPWVAGGLLALACAAAALVVLRRGGGGAAG